MVQVLVRPEGAEVEPAGRAEEESRAVGQAEEVEVALLIEREVARRRLQRNSTRCRKSIAAIVSPRSSKTPNIIFGVRGIRVVF